MRGGFVTGRCRVNVWIGVLVLCGGIATAQEASLSPSYVTQRDKAFKTAASELEAVGKWARENKLYRSARRAYEEVLRVVPGHAGATKWVAALEEKASAEDPPALLPSFESRWKEARKRAAKVFENLSNWAKKSNLTRESEEALRWSNSLRPADSVAPGDAEKIVLDDVNRRRRDAGLAAVGIDPVLSDGARKHAQYLITNDGDPSTSGLGAHNEDSSLPGYTPEGARAGKAADISHQGPQGSVDRWMATLYHRIPILNPKLRRIGVGFAPGGKWGWAGVLNLIEGLDNSAKGSASVRYPASEQKDVPLEFGAENPDPVPGGCHGAGYPVTLTFYDWSTVTGVSAVLRGAGGKEIACHLSTPEQPASGFPQQGTICLIPKAHLAPGTTYTVEINCKSNGRDVVEKWKFRTRP